MKIPPALWWVLIPTMISAITPVIAQFYPTDKVFWSALVVAVGGAAVAALDTYRSRTKKKKTPAPTPPPGVAADAYPGEEERQSSYLRQWWIG